MIRHLFALILVAVLAACSRSVVGARASRRLISSGGCDECGALCQEVHYKTLCTTLMTLPGVTTPIQLLDVGLRVTAAKAGMAEMKLDVALKSPEPKDNAMISSLNACRESYASLVDSLQSARETIKNGGSNSDLITELSSAATFSTDCEDIFDERPELTSPIPGAQRHISRLVSNSLEIAATMKQP